MQISADKITIAAQCCNAAITSAIEDLALITTSRAEHATLMLVIASDYLHTILSQSDITDGSTITPHAASA